MKKYYYIYCSYESWGRSYIGKRECRCLPEEDTSYFGSFSDSSFKPTEKTIIAVFDTVEEAFHAEQVLHIFFKVDENPHFANQHIQGFHSTYTHPKGSYWVNNGYENKFLKPWGEIPEGYKKGKLPAGYKNTPEYLSYKLKKVKEDHRKAVEASVKGEAREKHKATLKAIGHQKGEKNSQFGTFSIHNPVTLQNSRIKEIDAIPEGWVRGARFSKSPPEERGRLKIKVKTLEKAEQILKANEERKALKHQEKEAKVVKLRALYQIYVESGWKAVQATGYDKSQPNLVRQFFKYIPEFVPQNGKTRGSKQD